MNFTEDDAIRKIDELFQTGLRRHKTSYPNSSIDFNELNVTKRVRQARFPTGRGHFADVYKGEIDNDTPVAIKVLRLPAYDEYQENLYESVLLRFFRELHYWGSLEHINVARMLGFSIDQGNIGLVSLWYPNGNLVQYLNSNPDASKSDLALDIAEGIQYLHSLAQPIVHGDLKGVNVFISESGIACLGDFGISKEISDFPRKTGFTTTSGVSGTVPWMAPELLAGAAVTLASDVYAYACVILEIWCPGNPPYHYLAQETDVIMAKYRGEVPDPHHYPGMDDPEFLWDLLCSCWKSAHEDRPAIQNVVQTLYEHFGLNPRVVDAIARRPIAESAQLDLSHRPPFHVLKKAVSLDSDSSSLPGDPPDTAEAEDGSDMTSNTSVISDQSDSGRERTFLKVLYDEREYLEDLQALETIYLQPLRKNDPSFFHPYELDGFIDDVFGNISTIRGLSQKFMESLYALLRERPPNAQGIGHVILQAVKGFPASYPLYLSRIQAAKARLQSRLGTSWELRSFVENAARHATAKRSTLIHYLARPADHMHNFRALTEVLLSKTPADDPEYGVLKDATFILRRLFMGTELRMWQDAMGQGPMSRLEWDHVSRQGVLPPGVTKKEIQRQTLVFEFIRGEMDYVRHLSIICMDLPSLLRSSIRPIIPVERLETFMKNGFFNIDDILRHHRILLDRLHAIQREEQPLLTSIMTPLLGAVQKFSEVYVRYISHYPTTIYYLDEERENNPAFKTFDLDVSSSSRLAAGGLGIMQMLSRPMSRLPRWVLLLESMKEATPEGHEDHELIPQVRDSLKKLMSEAMTGLGQTERKVDLWKYRSKLALNKEARTASLEQLYELDLWAKERRLLHSGSLRLQQSRLRDPKLRKWRPLVVLLFDNYLVMTEEEGKGKTEKYCIYKEAIRIEDLDLTQFERGPLEDEPASPAVSTRRSPRSSSFLSRLKQLNGSRSVSEAPSGSSTSSSEASREPDVFWCTIKDASGAWDRDEGIHYLCAESGRTQAKWKQVLLDAKATRAEAALKESSES